MQTILLENPRASAVEVTLSDGDVQALLVFDDVLYFEDMPVTIGTRINISMDTDKLIALASEVLVEYGYDVQPA